MLGLKRDRRKDNMRYFPVAIIILFFCASVEAVTRGDWKMFGIYLLSAGFNILFLF